MSLSHRRRKLTDVEMTYKTDGRRAAREIIPPNSSVLKRQSTERIRIAGGTVSATTMRTIRTANLTFTQSLEHMFES